MPYTPQQMRDYQRAWYRNRRAAFFQDKCCADCGSTKNLELDHRDPSQKVRSAIWSWREERRVAEIAKCDIRCRACHSERHADQLRKHGGLSRYQAGCRCDACKAAKAEENKRYRERKARHSKPNVETSTRLAGGSRPCLVHLPERTAENSNPSDASRLHAFQAAPARLSGSLSVSPESDLN